MYLPTGNFERFSNRAWNRARQDDNEAYRTYYTRQKNDDKRSQLSIGYIGIGLAKLYKISMDDATHIRKNKKTLSVFIWPKKIVYLERYLRVK